MQESRMEYISKRIIEIVGCSDCSENQTKNFVEGYIRDYGADLLKLYINICETSAGIADKKRRIAEMCETYQIDKRTFSNFNW